MVLDFLTGVRIIKAVPAFPILYWPTQSDPPSLLILLPRSAKSSISSISSPSTSILSTFLMLILPFVFDLLILRPALLTSFPSELACLDCMPYWLCGSKATSSAKSKSPSQVTSVHRMPWRCFSVFCLIIQSMIRMNRKGDNNPWRTPVSIPISYERTPSWMTL